MKKSTLARCSGAIVLPVFIANLILAQPAIAEQIDRSRSKSERQSPSAIELNLSIPLDRSESDSEPKIQTNLKLKKSNHPDRSTSDPKEIVIQFKSIRRRNTIANQLNYADQSNPDSSIRRRNSLTTNSTSSTSTLNKDRDRFRLNSKRRIAAVSQPPLSQNYLRLVRDSSKGTNNNRNPIYTLEVYIRGVLTHSYDAVSGIASSQQLDRHIGRNHAPLPDGLYHLSDRIVPGAVPEVGKTFIGIYPQFLTNRRDLGIHVDPSFNLNNGRDGTSGCIGLTNSVDRDAINQFVMEYHPRQLFVSIANKSN